MRVTVLDDYQRVASSCADWDSLDADVSFVDRHLTGNDLINEINDSDVLVVMRERTPVDAALLARLPALRLLVTTGRRNASIDVDAAVQAGIMVCGTNSLATPTAEHTWALILAAVRHLCAEDAALRTGRWQTTVGTGLAGKTLGLVGLGRLGSCVAAIGQAFEMETIAWSQNLNPDHAKSLGVNPVAKNELFARSDVVSLHLVSSTRTRHVVGRAEIAAMRSTAYLVNTSRGPLVDTAALVEALDNDAIAGAALDVYDTEPLPADDPLRSAPRTVLTPHLGYVTLNTYELFFREAVEDIAAWRAGKPVRVIDP